jgi:hypothetical protein
LSLLKYNLSFLSGTMSSVIEHDRGNMAKTVIFLNKWSNLYLLERAVQPGRPTGGRPLRKARTAARHAGEGALRAMAERPSPQWARGRGPAN